MAVFLECLRSSLFRPAEHCRRLAAGAYDGSMRDGGESAAAACAPVALCLVLMRAFSPWPGGLPAPEQPAFGLFVAGTWPAAAGALWLLSRAFGYRPRYTVILRAWGATYWATALFLATLWATHAIPRRFGLEPAEIPSAYAPLALVAFLTAGLWKILSAIVALRFGVGARGWRFPGMIAALAGLGFVFALLSAILWGTKIPIA